MTTKWDGFVSGIVQTGAIASASVAVAAAACGYLQINNAAAPLNAVSHILFGRKAARKDALSLRHTGMGVLLNAGAVIAWTALHESMLRNTSASPAVAVVCGVLTATTAYVVDYHVVPRRFTPGFEKRLSGGSLVCIYAALAASLALGSIALNR